MATVTLTQSTCTEIVGATRPHPSITESQRTWNLESSHAKVHDTRFMAAHAKFFLTIGKSISFIFLVQHGWLDIFFWGEEIRHLYRFIEYSIVADKLWHYHIRQSPFRPIWCVILSVACIFRIMHSRKTQPERQI